ncbi:hypothetical protein, partial [Klebsiella aerogenes]|uniref:hypothetical protein n=1 Tax=Klebsiella aerogenes TaxID=548 RepID=UPI001954FEF0
RNAVQVLIYECNYFFVVWFYRANVQSAVGVLFPRVDAKIFPPLVLEPLNWPISNERLCRFVMVGNYYT